MKSVIHYLFDFLFSKQRCLIFTSFNLDDYFKVISKLNSSAISHRTKSRNIDQVGTTWGKHFIQYDVYVKKEDEYKAQQAINNRD